MEKHVSTQWRFHMCECEFKCEYECEKWIDHGPISVNANVNAIELTKDFGVPSQLCSKRDIPIHIHI